MTNRLKSSTNSYFDNTTQVAPSIARLIAFYLPQFHPTPENDAWWGAGFTEWTNVARARPLYQGHQQPILPADLGFYDLRLPEVREKQAELARNSGVEGFCYWHYWFGHGRRVLERPFNEVLASGQPEFPFCLAWANQSWTGVWHGTPDRILMTQEYPGIEDEKRHFYEILPAFLDQRYLKVGDKPIFVIYQPTELPNLTGFIKHWQKLATNSGLVGIYFVGITTEPLNPLLAVFDAVTLLSPADYLLKRPQSLTHKLLRKIRTRNFYFRSLDALTSRYRLPERYSYADVVEKAFSELPEGSRFHPCVLSNWDNTPRSGNRGLVLEKSSPDLFRTYLAKAVRLVGSRRPDEKLIFLKSWNEWAEGNFVEPDSRFGHAYLEAIAAEIIRADTPPKSH